MRLYSGVDLIEIVRVDRAIGRHGERFLKRVFTLRELDECNGRMDSLAVRFAAKEAVAKALGTGIGQVGWQEIEVLHGPENKPVLHLHGAAAEKSNELGIQTWSVSLSHSGAQAIALAVALAE